MAYSDTISQTTFNTAKVIQNAIRRCRIPAEQITAENLDVASDNLYLLLSDLANQGVPLWAIEKQLYPLYNGVGALTLDVGTVDVLNTFYRTWSAVTGTNTDTSQRRTIEFEDETIVTMVGIQWSAASVPISFQRSDDGISYTTVQSETPDAGDGEWTWYDLESAVASTFFRVQGASGTLSFDDIVTANNTSEIPLARMNRDNWTNLTDKNFTSNQVLQFWFDRQIPRPIMRLWPLPNEAAESQSLITVWRHRQIMDVGTLTQELEVPQRWQKAIVCMLAKEMAREMIEVDPAVIPQLDKDAAEALYVAQMEERDDSPTFWAPNISYYNA